jgi:chromosome segregation ATPase
MENLRKKVSNRNPGNINTFWSNKNTVEGHSSSLEQVKDSISELKDKIEIKEKIGELLVKQLKSCERNVQELGDSIKRPNLRIMGVEGEEVQAKGICNIFNETITKNFPNLKKVLPIHIQEAYRTTNRLNQNRTSPWQIIIKTTSTENRERILKV